MANNDFKEIRYFTRLLQANAGNGKKIIDIVNQINKSKKIQTSDKPDLTLFAMSLLNV